MRQHLFTDCEMEGVVNFLSISKKFAGRGGGGSIAQTDNKIQLCGVPVFQHPGYTFSVELLNSELSGCDSCAILDARVLLLIIVPASAQR